LVPFHAHPPRIIIIKEASDIILRIYILSTAAN